MARKLLLLLALISLVPLLQTTPGFTAIYDLPSDNGQYEWTETFAMESGVVKIGGSGSTLAGWNEWGDGGFWVIGNRYFKSADGQYKVESPVKVTRRVGGDGTTNGGMFYTFIYTYDESVIQNEEIFVTKIPDGPFIKSFDAELTITATYYLSGSTRGFKNGTLTGTGTDWLSHIPFTLSATIIEIFGEYSSPAHSGYFENFQLTYPASAVPVPGALWLLGTGLLGLFCLGRRRKQ